MPESGAAEAPVAVVTGAAGALGRAVAREFTARGHRVVGLDRAGHRFDELAHSDDVALAVSLDLTDRDAVHEAWQRVDDLGPTTALVTVAGGFGAAALPDLHLGDLTAMMDTNLVTALWCCQAAAPRMAEAGGGAIVTVAARAAVEGDAPVAYAAAKAAVLRATQVLAAQLRPQRIRVNCVLPSVIDTPANREWMSAAALAKAVRPEAIARVIAFLCGPDATPVSGAAVPVYGNA
ncbi:NADP-dependent 3-hydroxy acid dehydrogenase YdfG [Streptoalloteichus tenebrarius]|uniref:NADP-dependent 3-hydroxy acid dehydrogenase YdfG n=1 Tax=Streptoalloteichus tenebrarius (strain ATCC 17920 / DSM 40477 / JCM 4838 / CBS 697.72 / NBRC 16177 / NCIMB 11028 / NRRL B-12390 / A12253. 1 / ISP 5477) TaxID=1933 RepID=A0ABT1I2J6_STRSD|nr:SDR family NAD(P)-dependent oxidoreductase [Streptoalloteichus tenebrarius]MCP2261984.1 NADP-dependent 3-hydroxy acid dehydrogenase YdfG [Streptoalloteichus tenebrarius]BFF01286.1 SDR family NAD(P)-dependent oxidoreductase [Streptoalloteichus tenebrarius]